MGSTIQKKMNDHPSVYHATCWQEGKWFVAEEPNTHVASQGRTRKAALRTLEEALALHFGVEQVSVTENSSPQVPDRLRNKRKRNKASSNQ